ncbi:MAG TPA: hypothetical protein VMV94_07605 [Phycisphaerae bacterium]|nr:hypothetical protein [Phycisphaerae bacterium]
MNAELTTLIRNHPLLMRRTRFVSQAQPGERVLRVFCRPQHCLVVSEPFTPDAVAQSVGTNGDKEFLFAIFPAGPGTQVERCQDAQGWLIGSHDNHDGVLEVAVREDRMLWKAGRAAFLGPPERADEALAPLIEFAFVEGQIRRLEAEVDAAWTACHGHISLTHQVMSKDVARWPAVNEMTRRVTLCRMDCCDLRRQLESPSAELSAAARQVYGDLCAGARLADRLAAMEARINAMMSLYSAANDRLSAYSYFRREWWLEVWIILVIIAELAVIFLQLWLAGWK